MDYKGSRGRLVHSQAFFSGTASSLLPGAVIGSALALMIGGPGVLFWIWISSFFIMPLRFVSSTLAIRFRTKTDSGRYLSGPMYFIESALKARWLAVGFAAVGLLTVLVMGGVVPMLYVTHIANRVFEINGMTVPFLLSVILVFIVLGGVRRVGKVSAYLAPIGILLFFLSYFFLFKGSLMNFKDFIWLSFKEAFQPGAAITGGGFALARVYSMASGIFFVSTETGIGKSAGLSGVVRTDYPAKQGLVSMLATFFEGFIISTLVVYALSSYGAFKMEEQLVFLNALFQGNTNPINAAFFVSFLLFGVVSITGWFYTGEQKALYVFGEKFANFFRMLFLFTILAVAYLYVKNGEQILFEAFGLGYSLSIITAVPVLISLVLLEKIARTELKRFLTESGARYEVLKDFYLLILSVVPKNLLSRLFGLLASSRLPRFILIPILKAFARAYKINVDEAELEIQEYNSLNEFFTRALKAEARIIDSADDEMVSPVDAKITGYGDINQRIIIQAKGVDYNLKELLGGSKYLEDFTNGKYITFYLSPQDYHRIHSPAYGKILGYYYEPGKLFPVNELAVFGIRGLFPKNERLITYLQTEYGKVAVIKVGASNVGRIRVTYDNKIVTNTLIRTARTVEYKEVSIMIGKGAELGRFEMGSTVILLMEKDTFQFNSLTVNEKITYGTTIGKFKKKKCKLPK
ncbi:phosphatidylserine decarboxylase [Leptospira interrogans serovar Grippotyphosa str. UI 12769]|nr:phosphatidylserine decarboxylase [Leptospira interrogans serovar Grippotyphosa str. UI 08368]EMN66716.1 phosphatidylserine decarboxylase [Leptospira interrogans serovar Grippotyphosa str. UI 08434]EMN85515.1 phosphatidylserine decarboxylase [Leptospira interrogans serovar Grippotyphosa str. UI 12769]EMO91732.1 phosphatidylserine decarboxylase [Leptospira interrogans str. UI 13372]